jgi:putative membrane protein
MVAKLWRIASPLAAALPALAWAQPTEPSYEWPGPWHMMWAGGWGWGFGWIFPLLMIVMIGLCFYMMARMLSARGHGPSDGATALDILRERFAKGEISREEFEEKRAVLGAKP